MADIPALPMSGAQLHTALTALNDERAADGASAYELAIANGFVGTETEWLASLVGAPGTDGTDGVSPDFQFFATYAEALAYSNANPDAIVFSEEQAPQ